MVVARKELLRLVRQLAAKDEIRAMRLRGRLVVPMVPRPSPGHQDRP
jgi:hypothetical protein